MGFKQDWENSPPTGFNRSRAISEFRQHLFENWKRGEGPCNNCPNHIKKEKCFPAFGLGNSDAEIMIIGNSPGPRVRELEVDNKNRQIDPERLKKQPDFDGFPLVSFYNDNIEDINTWTGFGTVRKRFIEDTSGLNTVLGDNRIYFTNAKKCANIDSGKNEKAVTKCSSYLQKEIEIVNPSVIITWGLQAAKGAAQSLNYDLSNLPSNSMSLPRGDRQPTKSVIGFRETEDSHPDFITMPHWGMLGTNARHIPKFNVEDHDKPETYLYYQLADLVKHLINK